MLSKSAIRLIRIGIGVGLRLGARYLRRRADRLERLSRADECYSDLASAHRDEADACRRCALVLLQEARARGLLPERRRAPRPLRAPCGPYDRMRQFGLVDTTIFAAPVAKARLAPTAPSTHPEPADTRPQSRQP